jgi:hypothetical protein
MGTDFAKRLKSAPLWTIGGAVFRTFNGDDIVSYTMDGTVLEFKEIQWDEISVVGETPMELSTGLGSLTLRQSGGVVHILSALGMHYNPSGESTMTALWHTLIAGLHGLEQPAQDILSSGDRSNRKDIRQVIASEVLIILDITAAIQNLFSSIQSTFCGF